MVSISNQLPKNPWPEPDSEALAHSARVVERVQTEIEGRGGVLPFDRYMDLVLYEPGLGYYASGTRKFGRQGDFVTAPELGSLYGRCVARQVAQILAQLDGGSLLEFGAGSGVLAATVLTELAERDSLPAEYLIVEVSPALRAQQQQTLAGQIEQNLVKVRWLDSLPESGFRGVILANEVLDAMPIIRFRVGAEGHMTAGVVRRNGHLDWSWQRDPSQDGRIDRLVQQYGLVADYTSEVNPRAAAWMQTVGRVLDAGLILVMDYGYPGAEYYHYERSNGTLMCHYQHRAHMDPFLYPGLQDLTAHVDFSAVAAAGQLAGLDIAGFTSQEAFLLSTGVLDLVAHESSGPVDPKLSAELKQLTLSSEMGESFKALAMVKHIDSPLLGFSLRDRRVAL
ncbi:MAG: SAM-dependent methyltransferase [Gammaproteobacteria bacterium]|nr:SAM-dependent methyltransferase [Gammaproteobacteria bacterium]